MIAIKSAAFFERPYLRAAGISAGCSGLLRGRRAAYAPMAWRRPLTGHCATPKDSPGISNRNVGSSDSSFSRVLNPYEFGYRHLALIA